MKTITNALLALIASLLLANLIASPSNAVTATKTYDAVQLAEYSACLQSAMQDRVPMIALPYCSTYKPK
jgi:hypothetical protein